MTEAMSRHEIEDVLTSIRRLVSHEDRAAPAAPHGKLVLTSALRVDTPDTPAATDAPPEQPVAPPQAQPTPKDDSAAARPLLAQPAFADAPARPPLLTRIAQAGQLSAMPQPAAAPTAEEPSNPLEESLTDSALEATLSRLEEALSITPKTAPGAVAEDTVIDESALAQIVARIVRQELQGELGERITRNIRKLVRAEVARELQMRNL